jgi:hypothetical protein
MTGDIGSNGQRNRMNIIAQAFWGRTPNQLAATPAAGRAANNAIVVTCVWACWLLISAAALLYVGHYAENCPYADEFWMVPVLAHEQPLTLTWLWSQHNEHRIPIPRLIQVGLAKLTGTDFRAGMFFSTLLMSAASAALIVTAMRLRGRPSGTDIFFPLLLLGWGNCENLLWSFQVVFCASSVVTIGILIAISRCGVRLSSRRALAVGLGLATLPLCGAQGAVLVPPLALWLIYGEIRDARANGWRRGAHLPRLALPVLALGLVGMFFLVGYHQAKNPPLSSPWQKVRTFLEFMGAGFGRATLMNWPYVPVFVLLLLLLVAAALAVGWRQRPADRLRIAGLALFLGSMMMLAAAVAKGRACGGPGAGSASRYGWLAAPFCCWIYLVVSQYASLSVSRLVQASLLGAAVLLASENIQIGRVHGRALRQLDQFVREAARKDEPLEQIAKFFPQSDVNMRSYVLCLSLLRREKMGPYQGCDHVDSGPPRTDAGPAKP